MPKTININMNFILFVFSLNSTLNFINDFRRLKGLNKYYDTIAEMFPQFEEIHCYSKLEHKLICFEELQK